MNALHDLVNSSKIIVCVGSGGVGKTTTSAVIGLHAALHGLRVLVLTIDPAKRLANSLGLEGIGHREAQVPVESLLGLEEPLEGELWAMMLDMKEAFDEVVHRNTADPEAVERILNNKFYHYFSSSLAGTQEYSAVEQLYDISREGRYDLIVLDTPPSQHALDFLDAPQRLYEALDGSALQWMYRPALASGKIGLGFLRVGAKYLRRTLGRFTGGTMLEDLTVFLEGLSPLLDGFKQRAGKVREILHNASTVFLVVTTPDPLTIDEATYFDARLAKERVGFGGFVVNRIHPPIVRNGETLPEASELTDAMLDIPGAAYFGRRELAPIARAMIANARNFDRLAHKDSEMLDRLRGERDVPIFPVPFYSRDIYSIKGLNRVRADLFDDA